MVTLLTVSEQQRHSMLFFTVHSGKDELPAHRSHSGVEDTQKKSPSGASLPPGRAAHFKHAELNQASL